MIDKPPPMLQRIQELEKLYAGLAERIERAEARPQQPEKPTYKPIFQRWGPNDGSPKSA